MADEDDIIIRAILEDELSDPAERVRRALEELGRQNREASEDTDELTESQGRNSDSQDRNRRGIDRNTQSRDRNNRSTRTGTRETDSNTDSTRRNTRERDRSTKSAKSATKVFGKLNKLFMPIAKAGIILDAIGTAAPAIGALGAAGVAAGAGLSVMTGALLPLPALMLGAGQALGVMKMATSGMGDAIGALVSGDYAKFTEATKDMHPAAIATAQGLSSLGIQFKNIKKDVQGAVFAGLARPLTELGGKVLPLVRSSFLGTARGINGAAKELIAFLDTGKGIGQLRTILNGTSAISQDFAKGMGAAGKGLVGLLSATMPVARQMSEVLLEGTQYLADAIQNNQGRITAFAQRGYNAFARLMGVIVVSAKGLYNIGPLSMDKARQMGGGLEQLAQKFRIWTQSAEGQARIKKFFDDMMPVLQAIGRLIGAVSTAFMQLASQDGGSTVEVLDKLTAAIPTFVELVNQATGKFIPALLDVASSLSEVVVGMNMLGATSTILQAVAIPITAIANAFNALPGPVQAVIGHLVAYSLILKAIAGTALGQWIVRHIMATAVMTRLRGIVALMSYGLQLYARDLARAAGQKVMAGFRAMGTALMAVGRGFRAAALAVRAFSMSLMTFLFTNPIGWIILAVIALVAVFVILWKKCEGFRNLVKAIGQWFVDVWNNWIKPAVMATWEWIKDVFTRVWGFIKTVVSAIVNWFKSNWNTIKTVVSVVFTVLKAVAMGYVTYVKTVFTIIKTVVMVVFNVVKAIVIGAFNVIKGVVMFLAPVFKVVFTIIKNVVLIAFQVLRIGFYLFVAAIKIGLLVAKAIFTTVWNVIKAVALGVWTALKFGFNVFLTVLRTGFAVIRTVWNLLWLGAKTVFMVIWNAIRAVIGFFAPYVMGILNTVRNIFMTVWNAIRAVVGAVIGVIMGIIRTIIGVVQNVMGVVRGIWSSVWGTLSGIVSGVIGTISGIIERIRSVVTTVTNAVRNAFSTAFNAIRNVVMPILERISSFINGIKDAATGLADKVGGLVSMIPGLYAGGTPVVGQSTMVGELGPEAFVTHTGKVSMVGMGGPEVRQFHSPGYVVPNHVLATGQNDGSVPGNVFSKLQAAMAGSGAQADAGRVYDRSPRSNLSSNTYMQEEQGGGGHYDFRGANFGGSNPADIKAAVKSAITEAERERRRRG